VADIIFDQTISSATPDIHANDVRQPDIVDQSQPKSLTGTSWRTIGAEEWGSKPANVEKIRGAFGEVYDAAPPSITRPYQRSLFYPEVQKKYDESWWGPAVNVVGDTAGTALAGLGGVGNAALTLGNETLRAVGLPETLIRDLNLEGLRRVGEPTRPRMHQGDREAILEHVEQARELNQPPTPSVVDVWKEQRRQIPPDPTTAAAIDLLRRNAPPASGGVPTPPAGWRGPPFQPPPERAPTPPPPGTGFARKPTDEMVSDQMARESRGWYSPADEQAARGAVIKTEVADSLRKPITDAVPSDPEVAAARGNTPLVQLAKDAKAFNGQPMSYSAAMEWDTRLTTERQAAMTAGNKDLARRIGEVQDAMRERVHGLGDADTTGDATSLANLPNARKGWNQTMKQRQLEDIEYDAGLLSEDKRDAYRRQRVTALLRNDKKMRGWSDDERAALETQLKSGQIGSLKNFALSFVKPTFGAAGGTLGGAVGGPAGAFVGGQAAAEVGARTEAALRQRLSRFTLDPVTAALSRNMPPPPPGQ
jgi:hypothetical protein